MNCILYSTGCPKCKILEKKLTLANIEYEVITDEEKIITTCKENATNSLPLLEVDGKFYNFSNAVKWVGEQR